MFCEKPIAFTADESRDVRQLANSSVPVQIGYNRRFPPYVAAYDAVRRRNGRLTTVGSTTMDPAAAGSHGRLGRIFRLQCARFRHRVLDRGARGGWVCHRTDHGERCRRGR